MNRFAMFIDAGYFFAQGSVSLTGKVRSRHELELKEDLAIQTLKDIAHAHLPNQELLRIYWYDGARGSTIKSDQSAIASLNDVKLRLGMINQFGKQKGVDSLIVADLIELARLRSITDAFLLSGDEDVRVGVQLAQNHGVRVHLLGIESDEGTSQGRQLLQEADTVLPALLKNKIGDFLHFEEKAIELTDEQTITKAVHGFINNLSTEQKNETQKYWNAGNRGVPQLLDGKLLSYCGRHLGRYLETDEIKYMRARFQEILTGAAKI
ncbi:MAG: NYN domain-containing protein [Hyphomicrobiales bacterium]|nr:NYN domain-containing protein [Hyphomicrobiales bacterium]